MTPSYADVPEHWKQPAGPYRQAPAEHGGEWWLVNPFTGSEPWLLQSQAGKPEALPEGFEEIFGPRPESSDFHQLSNPSLMFRIARTQWEQDLRHFKQAGAPEWASTEELSDSEAAFQRWGMGAPKHYEGRYGWMTRFPESEIADFEAAAWTAIQVSHLTIAQYQLRLVDRDIVPREKHPFVPPHVWPDAKKGKEVA